MAQYCRDDDGHKSDSMTYGGPESFQECMQLCLDDPNCKGFEYEAADTVGLAANNVNAYNGTDKRCELHSNINAIESKTQTGECVFGLGCCMMVRTKEGTN